jgi:hypothetical protein
MKESPKTREAIDESQWNDDLVAVTDEIAERPACKGDDSCWLR